MTDGREDKQWNVALDEAAGTVGYSIPSMGVNQKYQGVFTADKVIFSSMEISRIDLSLKRTTNILGKVTVDKGQCQLVSEPKRKF